MKKFLLFIITAFIIIAIGIGGYIAYERFTLHQTVDKFLEKRNAIEQVKTRETHYDSKLNEFYEEIVFKDEPNLEYDMRTRDVKDNVLSTAYGKNGEVRGKYSNGY
ncbi:DUF3139 domain-containing protein [Macrococcoides canis]|uniref:DUF3139 domain-containing protein n=1 Tax=Macrococcoides canis TaxID=1855823 RepID=UPI0020B78FE2|nr:DUF3139 domain-containing protein [Macrococcus canis]UTH06295.1 DUF3139 domain-containing protein [Macrococcus canis]